MVGNHEVHHNSEGCSVIDIPKQICEEDSSLGRLFLDGSCDWHGRQ